MRDSISNLGGLARHPGNESAGGGCQACRTSSEFGLGHLVPLSLGKTLGKARLPCHLVERASGIWTQDENSQTSRGVAVRPGVGVSTSGREGPCGRRGAWHEVRACLPPVQPT